MKRLLIGAALCSLVAAPALAGEPAKVTEPVRLSSTQMDRVTAGQVDVVDVCKFCRQVSIIKQDADAKAFSWGGDATAVAANVALVSQEIN